MANILIIDDEQNILVTLSRALGLEGFSTLVAGSAKVGLQKLVTEEVDLVLLDVKLPDLDGVEVLSKIREKLSHLPVIMMSGHATIEVAVRAVQLGAIDFLEKPLSTERVLVAVRNALKMQQLVLVSKDSAGSITTRQMLPVRFVPLTGDH